MEDLVEPLDEEEQALMWQDVLDEIVAGRKANLVCPFCQKGPLTIDETPLRTKVTCGACRRFIEGKLTNADPNRFVDTTSTRASNNDKK